MALPDRPTVRVTSSEDLLALVPFLLGFHPDASLVLVVIDRGHLPMIARLPLPGPDVPGTALRDTLGLVTADLNPRDGLSVVLVGYGPAAQVQPAVDAAGVFLRRAGIPVSETLRVADGRFWHLGHGHVQPDDGIPLEPATNPAAATAVYAGLVAHPHRDAFAATLAPVTGPARDRMVTATAAACQFLVEMLDAAGSDPAASSDDPDAVLDTPLGLAVQKAARTYLTQAQASYKAGRRVDDEHAATVTVLLNLPSLRDFAVRRTSHDVWQIEMWTDLVRRAEPPFVADPAILLALCALRAGNGALASIAIDRALDTEPDNPLARVLAAAIAAGIGPDTVAALLAD